MAEEVRRGERVVAIDEEAVLIAPWASRLPFQLMLAPRTPAAPVRAGRPVGSLTAARRALPARPPPRVEPTAEHVGPDRPSWSRGLLLADRRAATSHPPRGTRALDGAEPQHRLPRAGGGRPAGGLRGAPTATLARVDGARGTLRAPLRRRAPTGGPSGRTLGGAPGTGAAGGRPRPRGRAARPRGAGADPLVPRPHLARTDLRPRHRPYCRRVRAVRVRPLPTGRGGRGAAGVLRLGRLHRPDRGGQPAVAAGPVRRGDRTLARRAGGGRRDDPYLGASAGVRGARGDR